MPAGPSLPCRSGSSDSLSSEAWAQLQRVLERFEEAWKRGERPALDVYLVEAGPAERTALLAELIQWDLTYRLQAGETVRVETYLKRYPELGGDRERVLGLIRAEFAHRRHTDPDYGIEELLLRFPQYAAELPVLLTEAAESAAPPNDRASGPNTPTTAGATQAMHQLDKLPRPGVPAPPAAAATLSEDADFSQKSKIR